MKELPISADVNRKRFRFGVLLVWVPLLILIAPGILSMADSISASKTTGLGAVAGGWSEAFGTFGIVSFVTMQIAAIVLLARSFNSGDRSQKLTSILTILVSVGFLLLCATSIWLLFHFTHS